MRDSDESDTQEFLRNGDLIDLAVPVFLNILGRRKVTVIEYTFEQLIPHQAIFVFSEIERFELLLLPFICLVGQLVHAEDLGVTRIRGAERLDCGRFWRDRSRNIEFHTH